MLDRRSIVEYNCVSDAICVFIQEWIRQMDTKFTSSRSKSAMENASRTMVADCIYKTSVVCGGKTVVGFSPKSHKDSDVAVEEQLSGEVAIGGSED